MISEEGFSGWEGLKFFLWMLIFIIIIFFLAFIISCLFVEDYVCVWSAVEDVGDGLVWKY